MASQQSTDTTHNYRVLLKKQRVALVDQLNVSDGLYDHLIKYDIAGTREINRIKEEGKTREGQAALLLDYLETRPEKDLDKFVESLEKTNQGHLAKLFKSDSVKMSVRVTDIHEREQKPSTDSKLQLSETVTTPYSSSDAQLAEKRKIAESALLDLITKLSNECVENLSKMDENETKIDKLFGHIKILRGEHCSILLHIKCPNIAVLDYLWLLCETGGLTKIFQGYFVTDELLDKMDLSGMKLEAGMLLTDYMAHRNYLRIEETHYCKESTDSSEVSGPSMLKRPSYPLQIYRPDVAASTAIRAMKTWICRHIKSFGFYFFISANDPYSHHLYACTISVSSSLGLNTCSSHRLYVVSLSVLAFLGIAACLKLSLDHFNL